MDTTGFVETVMAECDRTEIPEIAFGIVPCCCGGGTLIVENIVVEISLRFERITVHESGSGTIIHDYVVDKVGRSCISSKEILDDKVATVIADVVADYIICKAVLRNEAIDAIRERKYRKKHEVTFSDLSPQEENQLYTCDKYFVNDEAEKSFFVAGKEITAKQLADALHSLPEEKRQAVLLYYFFDMKDAEIAELMKIPRSTVQFRRTSSFELLKRFLEESR